MGLHKLIQTIAILAWSRAARLHTMERSQRDTDWSGAQPKCYLIPFPFQTQFQRHNNESRAYNNTQHRPTRIASNNECWRTYDNDLCSVQWDHRRIPGNTRWRWVSRAENAFVIMLDMNARRDHSHNQMIFVNVERVLAFGCSRAFGMCASVCVYICWLYEYETDAMTAYENLLPPEWMPFGKAQRALSLSAQLYHPQRQMLETIMFKVAFTVSVNIFLGLAPLPRELPAKSGESETTNPERLFQFDDSKRIEMRIPCSTEMTWNRVSDDHLHPKPTCGAEFADSTKHTKLAKIDDKQWTGITEFGQKQIQLTNKHT